MFLRGIVSCAQDQGPREAQEDHVIVFSFQSKTFGRCHLLGIADGHEGDYVSRTCARAIPQILDRDASDVAHELSRVIAAINDRTALSESGSTISLVWLSESRRVMTAAVLGDSPIIVVDRTHTLHISEAHNARSNPREREEAVRRGAFYDETRGYLFNNTGGRPTGNGVQLTRVLGDHALRKFLSRTPTTSTHKLGRSSVVIVGSDGLLDCAHEEPQEEVVAMLVHKVSEGAGAEELLAWRKTAELHDNTSLIVWRPKTFRELLAW